MNPLDEIRNRLVLETLKRCYRKHHLNDDSIGWDQLADEMCNTLSEAMGDREFQQWVAELSH